MTLTTLTTHPTRPEAAPAGSRFTGVGSLLRLALRRDRIRLSVWISILTLTMVYAPNAVKLAYPEEAQRLARVNLLKTPAGMMLGGPMFGGKRDRSGRDDGQRADAHPDRRGVDHVHPHRDSAYPRRGGKRRSGVGAVVGGRPVRAYVCGADPGGRRQRDTGRHHDAGDVRDRLRDRRHRRPCAWASPGCRWCSAAVAAVTAQLWRQARTATGAAMAVLALAALVRGIGDVINNSGSALSWFSPIAWAQQMRPFVDLRWWPFALLVALTLGLMLLAAVLESRRQYDDGNIPSTGERPNAHPIKSAFGLHLTLQRGQMIGWSVGLFLAGLAFGSMTKSLLDAAEENELLGAGAGGAGHRRRLHHDDAVPRGRRHRLCRRGRGTGVHRRRVRSGRAGAGRCGVAVALAADRRGRRAARVDGADVLRRPGQRPGRRHHTG